MRRQHHPGQALVIVALFLPIIIGLWLLAIELAWRFTTTQSVNDALRAANRSAVQTFDYAAFADNRLALADPDAVIAVAQRLAATNLSGVRGLAKTPADVAGAAQWTVLPAGGACILEAGGPTLRFPKPALCSTARVDLSSPLGFNWTIQVYAADTLDLSFSSATE
jgi:Flp pilus assembly protein TadG